MLTVSLVVSVALVFAFTLTGLNSLVNPHWPQSVALIWISLITVYHTLAYIATPYVLTRAKEEPSDSHSTERIDTLMDDVAETVDTATPHRARVFDALLPLVQITPRHPHSELLVSTGALNTLDDDELKATIAHELGHYADIRGHIYLFLADNMIPLCFLAFAGGVSVGVIPEPSMPPVEVLMLIAAILTLAQRILKSKVKQSRELVADKIAVTRGGIDPREYAQVLRKIEAAAGGTPPATLSYRLFASHPPVDTRVEHVTALEDHDARSRV